MNFIQRIIRSMGSIYAIVLFVLLMLIVFPAILLCTLFRQQRRYKAVYAVLRMWAVVWYRFIFIRHKTIGRENETQSKQFIYVANHSSYIDIPQLLLATHRAVKVLGRHDLAKVPIFGAIYRSATILVDRSSIKSRVESFNRMKTELEQGVSIFIFPEGSFNESDKVLKPFVDGAFKLSVDSGVPILPVVFPDTAKRLNNKSLLSFTTGISRSIILKPVMPEEGISPAALKQEVFENMQNALLACRKNE